jgi:type II restriction/modification system DNA methylase subunit YeeA
MQSSLTYRTNRDLFSNYYLDEHLPETEEWGEVDDDELEAAYDEIVNLYDQEKSTAPKRNESQLEEKFIRPMFRKLGIPFEVEESTSRTQRRPDYGFFETEDAARDAFERREGGGDFYENAVAVADAKRWGRPLDTRGSGEHKRDFENPSYQIHVYLQETPARWAVLTDGKKWRLYYGPTSHRLDSYYEVDLPTVLEKGDLEDFKYFYLFFRHGAFLEDAGGDCFLDDVYDESNVFAQDLGEDLQDNIYEAIKILSEGYLQYPDNDLDEGDLDLVHDSSLIYLYRLIFVLYAEAEGRDLLDTDNEIYEESYSLNSLKQEVAKELDSGDPKYRDWQDDLSSRLDELFELIDQGSKSRGIPEEDLHIPAYNGGLFRTDPDEDDSPEAKFLAEHTVGDAYLARVVELLTRSRQPNGGGKIFVDYSSLDVRHLGSIYEGLLEYQLHVADGPLTVDDGEYVETKEGDDVVVEAGEVYLTTGSGERKATGSYYTPEYVVEYIVDETLGPLVGNIREDLVGQTTYRKGDDEAGAFADEFAERVFDLKILDPAMGSGHFLTSAVDYLAREIIDAQERQAAQQGVETVDEERDINWARRKVAQRCIYGVDLNPLATELAKVSLWLRTLAAEQPLAFLDHHLKTGNSLVGSDIEDVLANGDGDETNDGQLTLEQSFAHTRQQALEHVMDRFQSLLAIDNETLADAKEMEDVYDTVRDDLLYQHLLAMANVHTAERFGLDVPSDADKRMAEALRADSWSDIEGQDWFTSAQAMAADERFFHWELEFPVAFYNEDGERKPDAGFDAVIGNPPYFRMNTLSETDNDALRASYPQTYQGGADILTLFLTKGIDIARTGGKLGYIITRYFLESTTAESTREYILQNTQVDAVVDFDGMQPFPSVSIQAIIPILTVGGSDSTTDIVRLTDSQAAYSEVEGSLQNTRSSLFERYASEIYKVGDANSWTFYPPRVQDILEKIQSNGVHLARVAEVAKAMESGRSGVLVVSPEEIAEHDLEEELLKPIVKSGDVRRYYLEENDDKLIWTEGIDIERYPNTKQYLEPHKDDLASRYDIEARGSPWWYISNPRNEDLFENHIPRVLTPYMSPHNRFYVDHEGYYNDGGDIRGIFPNTEKPYSAAYLTAILNSKAGEFYHHRTSKRKDAGKYEYFGNVLNQFPIASLEFSEAADTSSTVPDEVIDDYRRGEATVDEILSRLTNGRIIHDTIESLARDISETYSTRLSLNLNLLDYLGNYEEGPTFPDVGLFQPSESNVLDATTEEYEKLRVGDVRAERDGASVTISATARYKPEDEDAHETDIYGYTETEFVEAFTLVDCSEREAALVAAFVPVAVDDEIAGFRANATKTNSLVDRLKAIALPDPDDVADDLHRYVETKERADELDATIAETDRLIDEIVYDLYDLTDEEIEIVESAVADD